MDHTPPAPVDPQELEHARKVWHGFTKAATFAVLHIAVLLAVLAFFFGRVHP